MTPLTQIKLLSFKDNFKELVNLSLRNKLANKLILSGNKGIGKSTFAFHLINYLFSQDEEGSYNLEDNEININNKSYKHVSNNTHPNLLLIDSTDKKFIEVSKNVDTPVRKYGSASLDLASVACGRFDGFWQRELSYWDIAAGIVIVKEAGGFIDYFDDNVNESKKMNLLATNSLIHKELMDLINKKNIEKN